MSVSEQKNKKIQKKAYLKAMPLKNIADLEVIKHELSLGNILILKVTPLARKSVDDVKKVVNELCGFTQSIGGDIASLGEERVVIVPNFIRIWRQGPDASKHTATTAA